MTATDRQNNRAVADLQVHARNRYRDWATLGNIEAHYKDDLVMLSYKAPDSGTERWRALERVCQGLILEMGTGRVVARPFDKFFGWGDVAPAVPRPGKRQVSYVMEKVDGSLGIVYWNQGTVNVATKDGFDTEAALWATNFVQKTRMTPRIDRTHLYEIVYPDNQQVVDYGRYEGLRLLAIRETATGDFATDGLREMQAAKRIEGITDMDQVVANAAALDALSEFSEQEGFVAVMNDGSRWKIQCESYKELRKFGLNLTPKKVYDAFVANNLEEAWRRTPRHMKTRFANILMGFVATYTGDAALLDVDGETAHSLLLENVNPAPSGPRGGGSGPSRNAR